MRELDEVETVYSSFTYLLDAIRIISGLIRNYADLVTPWDDMIAATDARIAAWTSLLPTCKKEPIHPDGTVDEVMYFAHLAILILIVQLHRPQSSVTYSKEEWQTGFIPCPPMNMIPTKHERRNVHTAKILRALEKQTQLLTLPSPLILHAPFTVCIVAGCATAHVATCALFPDDRRLEVGRDRLRLSIGAVRACADIWPLNRQMLADAQMVAKGTLSPSTSLPRQPAREPLAPMNFQYTSSPEALDDFSFTIGPMSDVDIFSTLELSSMHQDWSALLDPSSLSTL
jgi:nicotinate-nucleotide pyrophosphorylase (carboxylating)